MYILKDNKIILITTLGRNKTYYYFTVSEFNEMPSAENFNPISQTELKWETTEHKRIGEIYSYLLTQPQFNPPTWGLPSAAP